MRATLAAAQRRDHALAGAAVAVERGAVGGKGRSSAATAAAASRSTSAFQPASIVSVHSVVDRSVTHGTPAR